MTHFLNLIKHTKLNPQDMLVTVGVSFLHTTISNYDRIAALTRIMYEVGIEIH